jgi:PIN domain nuclease of toxin-antitoxin system
LSVVLDASAVLAVLLDEPGSDTVIGVMRGSAISSLNASECFQRVVDKGFPASAVTALLLQFEIEVVSFDLTQAAAVANLRTQTKSVGASLGDRAFLNLGLARGRSAYTADRRLGELDIDLDIRLIR